MGTKQWRSRSLPQIIRHRLRTRLPLHPPNLSPLTPTPIVFSSFSIYSAFFTNQIKNIIPCFPSSVSLSTTAMALCARTEVPQPILEFPPCYRHTFHSSPADPRPKIDDLWRTMRAEARSDSDAEPVLSGFYFSSILSHDSIESALANYLAVKLASHSLPAGSLYDLFLEVFTQNQDIIAAVAADLRIARERDPACISYVHCFLNFKGFLACQAHRIAHHLWRRGRKAAALLIQNRASEVFAVDIHPGARIGAGVLFDHATGVVIGETAVIGDNVAILHNVTLGGTGKEGGDRHPKIGDGALIGAGTCILGNIRIGEGAKIGAGSVVLKAIPARTTAVGNPARLLGGKGAPVPSLTMDQTSHSQWSDYVI